MTSTQKVIDQELAQFGWVESIATNSISDFKSPKENFVEPRIEEEKSDLIDIFVCHVIFYIIFCYSLFLHIFVDLGLGSFLENKMNKLLNIQKKMKTPSFISSRPY